MNLDIYTCITNHPSGHATLHSQFQRDTFKTNGDKGSQTDTQRFILFSIIDMESTPLSFS